MPIPDNDVKCALSEVYASAISIMAGFPCVFQSRLADNLGIDARFEIVQEFGPEAQFTSFSAAIQLKTTSKLVKFNKAGRYRFKLDVKTYDRYRSIKAADMMLVVLLVLPKNRGQWLRLSPKSLSIRGRAYWISLYGAPATKNTKDITISVPEENTFTVGSLTELARKFAHDEKVRYAD